MKITIEAEKPGNCFRCKFNRVQMTDYFCLILAQNFSFDFQGGYLPGCPFNKPEGEE